VLADHYDREVDIWMLTEKRVKDQEAIRAVLDYLGAEIRDALRRVAN
jgi:hypothetical protein